LAVHGGVIRRANFGVIGVAEQECCVGVADGCAYVRRSVEDIPAGAVVSENVVVVIGDALEVRAKFEGMFSRRPTDVVECLNNLAALHAGVARAGGHESVDEHLRRLGPAQVRLRDAEPGLRQQRGGRVTLSLRGVLRVVAAAEFVQQVGREDIVVGKGQALVDLGCIRDLHLLDLADDHEYRAGCATRTAGLS